MACGVPVIVTNRPRGPTENVTCRVDGLLVPVGDDEALASSIAAVLNDRSPAQNLAMQGRSKAQQYAVKGITR